MNFWDPEITYNTNFLGPEIMNVWFLGPRICLFEEAGSSNDFDGFVDMELRLEALISGAQKS